MYTQWIDGYYGQHTHTKNTESDTAEMGMEFFHLCNTAMQKLINEQSQNRDLELQIVDLQKQLTPIIQNKNEKSVANNMSELQNKIEAITDRIQF